MALRGLHQPGENYVAGDVTWDDAGNIYYTPISHTSTAENAPVPESFVGVPNSLLEVLQRSVDLGQLTAPALGQREYLYWEDV